MPEKRKADDNLYPIEVIEKVGSRVKIHYTGYESDKWREEKENFETATYTTDHIHMQVCPNAWRWK